MNDQTLPIQPESQQASVDFNHRPPSVSWEPIPVLNEASSHSALVSGSPIIVWAWFKPQGIPNQLIVSIPQETYQAAAQGLQLTVLQILNAVQIEVGQLASLSIFGMPVEISGRDHAVLHQVISPPGLERDPYLLIFTAGTSAVMTPAVAGSVQSPESAGVVGGLVDDRIAQIFRSIETSWIAIRQIESKLKSLRKQLDGLLSRLNGLNRDLSAEECTHADSMDLRAWQDARRWLRDLGSRISRYLKEHDIGLTSNAGSRQRLLQIYEQFVVSTTPFEGIEQVQREFDAYRKMVQNLMQSMSSAQASAQSDGEQRAQQVLRQIAAKARAARTKR